MSHPLRIYREGDAKKMVSPIYDPLSCGDIGLVDMLACRSYAYTLSHHDRILAVGGVFLQWKHCYLAWTVVDERAKDHSLLLVKVAKIVMDSAVKALIPRRIEANVDMSVNNNVRFAKMAGFKEEYVKVGAGPMGSDVMQLSYGRV